MLHQNAKHFLKKMYDYGSAWRILRLSSLTDQIFIKAQRIRGLQKIQFKKLTKVKLMSLSVLLIIR